MGKKVRSARGEIVDFDLMKIKEQIASAPTPLEVKARQNFIENRMKRRIKKAQNAVDVAKDDTVAPKLPEPAPAVDESHIEEAETKEEVSEALAAVEAMSEEPVKEEAPKKVVKKRTTKQRARPKKKTEEAPESETEDKEE